MTIDKQHENEKLTLVIDGHIDFTTADKLRDSLIPSFDEARELILDFAKVAHISSAGIRVLLAAHKKSKAKGVSLVISNITADVMDTLTKAGFADKLTII
ncbi:MAG: STAS domain-containing protein [Defluviitaleaceae bacterium]|nr:STAS domain-containing protein [Defluviitaleaceae bacterium]